MATAVASTIFRRRERFPCRKTSSRLTHVGQFAACLTLGSDKSIRLAFRAKSRRKVSSGQGPTGVVSPASTRSSWRCASHDSKRSSAREGQHQLIRILGTLQEGKDCGPSTPVLESMHDEPRCGPSLDFLRSLATNIRASASRRSIVRLAKGAKTTVWHRLSVLPPDGRHEAAPYRASTQTGFRGCASPRVAWHGAG